MRNKIIFSNFRIFVLILLLVHPKTYGNVKNNESELFLAALIEKLAVGFNFNWTRNDLINTNNIIDRPSYTWALLLSFDFFNEDSTKSIKKISYCLWYKVPKYVNKKIMIDGKMKINEQVDGICKVSNDKVVAEFNNVNNLKIFFQTADTMGNKVLISRQVQLKSYHLTLIFDVKGNELKWEIPFYNYKINHSKSGLLYSGVLAWETMPINLATDRLIGNRDDDYREEKITPCHTFNKECVETMSFNCHRCQFSWYETVSEQQCSQGGNKYCGEDKCGKRGQPSCPAGENSSGLCGPDLTPYLDGRKVYICL